jgi:hypothetical protein
MIKKLLLLMLFTASITSSLSADSLVIAGNREVKDYGETCGMPIGSCQNL